MIEIKPKKIDFETFHDYAVYISSDFSNIHVNKAFIGKPVERKCHGILPSKGDGFNCCIGDYTAKMCLIYMKSNLENTSYIFDINSLWATVDNIYTKEIKEDLINTFLKTYDYSRNIIGYYGFFNDRIKLFDTINKKRKEYMDELQFKLKRIIPYENIEKYIENYSGTL